LFEEIQTAPPPVREDPSLNVLWSAWIEFAYAFMYQSREMLCFGCSGKIRLGQFAPYMSIQVQLQPISPSATPTHTD